MSRPAFEIPEEVLDRNPRLREDYEEALGMQEQEEAMKSTTPAKEVEKNEIRQLLEVGGEFECPTILRRIFGVKTSTWKIKPMAASTLVRLCNEYLEIVVDEDAVEEGQLVELKNLVAQHGHRMAKIVAISVTGSTPFVGWILRPLLTKYFYDRMTPDALLKHAIKVNNLRTFVDFLTSIRLTQGKRLTQPTLIEESGNKRG